MHKTERYQMNKAQKQEKLGYILFEHIFIYNLNYFLSKKMLNVKFMIVIFAEDEMEKSTLIQ